MADELFFLGGYGVKPSDIIAVGALVFSAATAMAATRSARAATRSATTAVANFQRELDKEKKSKEIRVSTIVQNDDDEGPGPQRHLSLIFQKPLNGDLCELRECEIVHPKGCMLNIRYYDKSLSSKVDGKRMDLIRLVPAVTLDNRDVQINVTFHLLAFDNKPTHLRFHGERLDATRTKVSVDVVTPPIDRNRW